MDAKAIYSSMEMAKQIIEIAQRLSKGEHISNHTLRTESSQNSSTAIYLPSEHEVINKQNMQKCFNFMHTDKTVIQPIEHGFILQSPPTQKQTRLLLSTTISKKRASSYNNSSGFATVQCLHQP